MKSALTPRQQRVYDFIAREIQSRGLPPTVREIARQFSLSVGAVQGYLRALEMKGSITRAKERARGLFLTVKAELAPKLRLPILGRVPAGVPLEAITDIEDYLSVDESIAKQANFALRVRGDSMTPAIYDGDLVLVKYTRQANNGDIVIAFLEDEGEATVKTLRKDGSDLFLEAINPRYRPIKDRPFEIVGKVTSLIRTFFQSP
jgi:repressor LexA